ncbi:nucleotidyltransferase domain-containing protein [uncultured Acetatifactor sp.]|jgi:predicted nucleotidyltransferase|uniref:nucleotidyltransferase domain-containing protein n=1 Tax=uncultured Acetatifactor sp. TaxID=1671927 RepID=UPI00260272AD|nr:nucleotidyltransferase domain-containing protein [uncultured Acetatifactor sp.]MCI8695626.1 nucleotidyltransferase [Lachnospiraceae bacterium]MCI9650662.1 nucleotidyltransferase [Lachnospiraceae bacterium]
MEYREILQQTEYGFIKTNEHLGRHVILLGLAGSYAYGTNIETSDIDIRGIALNRKSDLIGLTQFDQYVDEDTDTVIYAFNKIVTLLLGCNPNTIELLGLKPEHYLYLNDSGRLLLDNRKLFLSKRAIQSFGGYADAQLRRLQNALARDTFPQSEKEQHILNSVRNAMHDFNHRYRHFENGSLELFIDKAMNPELDTEIFVNASMTHYPLRDYECMWNTMANVVRDYEKIGKRNKKKDDLHLNKHAMHLVRLFMMALDILEKGEIHTYREKEHNLLMDIRSGKYQKEDGTFHESFYEMLTDFEKRLHYAAENTDLPEEPDMEKVQELVMTINERVVRDEI